MYSKGHNKHVNLQELYKLVQNYLYEHNIPVWESSQLDSLIENPHLSRLLMIWLQNDNELQLNHLFVKINEISQLPASEQIAAGNQILARAAQLSNCIPILSDLDLVIENIREHSLEEPDFDNWANFNFPLHSLSGADLKRLSQLAFFINRGLFSANKAMSMKPLQLAAFHARAAHIMHEMKERKLFFSDDFVNALKNDGIIQDILSEVVELEPVAVVMPKQEKEAVAIPEQSVVADTPSTALEESDNFALLAKLLELDTESILDEDEEQISSIVGSPGSEENTISTLSSPDLSETKSGFWRNFNIDFYDLYGLIETHQLKISQIPDRELSSREIAVYRLMNKLKEDTHFNQKQFKDQSTQTATLGQEPKIDHQEPGRTPDSSIKSGSTENWDDMQQNYSDQGSFSQRSTSTVAYEYPTSEPKQQNSKPIKDRFYGVVKDQTHNVVLQEVNRRQRKFDQFGTQKDMKSRIQEGKNKNMEEQSSQTKSSKKI
jgi:hypothetical protein